MEFQDKVLECTDCHTTFTFTAGEQEFYDRKGFKEVPKRCKSCRETRKQRRGPGDAPFHAAPAPTSTPRYAVRDSQDRDRDRGMGAAGGRPQRELFDAVCAACGAPARVPFRPAPGRPVYCRDCFANRAAGA